MSGSLYRYLARSEAAPARMVRAIRRAVLDASIPLPPTILRIVVWPFLVLRSTYYFLMRVVICEPFFRSYCRRVGKGFHTSTKLHWVQGKGHIDVGDNVLISGLCTFTFAVRFSDNPTLTMGDGVDLASGCTIVVGKSVSIGNRVMVGPNVSIRDSNGHPVDYKARRSGQPMSDDEVKPVIIEDDVWIGANAVIGPGMTVGEGSVVAANSVIYNDVKPYTVVGGNPARKIGVTRAAED